MSGRIGAAFARVKAEKRAALITFIMACDPDEAVTADLLAALPEAGADIIELGMPFSDPMADGPAIQAAGIRALQAGASLKKVLALAQGFRAKHASVPLVLMGYFNPILAYGQEDFIKDAAAAGVDGLILVDLPPEEDGAFRALAGKAGVTIVRLATPTTDAQRLPQVLNGAGGFLYYVSIAGITGTKSASVGDVRAALERFRQSSDLPMAVGFGVRTAEQLKTLAAFADGVIVGSALVDIVAANAESRGRIVPGVTALVRELAAAAKRD